MRSTGSVPAARPRSRRSTSAIAALEPEIDPDRRRARRAPASPSNRAGPARAALRVTLGVVPDAVRHDVRRQDGLTRRVFMTGLHLRRHLLGTEASMSGQAADPADIMARRTIAI